jgi:hypothetical protein
MEFVKYIPSILLISVVCATIVWRWVIEIDYMSTNYPDYKGDDLFGLDEDDKTQIG